MRCIAPDVVTARSACAGLNPRGDTTNPAEAGSVTAASGQQSAISRQSYGQTAVPARTHESPLPGS